MKPLRCALVCAVIAGCSTAVYEPRLHPAADEPDSASVHGHRLKVHLMSGQLLVLSSWARTDSFLVGRGERYDLQRRLERQGFFTLPLDSIALLETEIRSGSRPSGVVGMAIWTTLWTVTTVACVADPKSCFGSCPTFYVPTDSGDRLVAEGFSASIARALEAKDLDALFAAQPDGGVFTIRMRNEALETHAVRSLTLLAAPRPVDGRVLPSPEGRLFPATDMRAPTACRAEEGNCRAPLLAPDGVERTSPADSTDLAARETMELTFPPATGRLGLVLAARQSLLSTYLFYQTMGFLGSHAGDALAAMEQGGTEVANRAMGMGRLIAPIEADVLNGDRWTHIGTHDEAGPLATQFEVLPFVHMAPGPVRIRLTLTRGAWRLDWVALASLGHFIRPVPITPEAILRGGRADSTALALLNDPREHLITYPGDSLDIVFRLPRVHHTQDVFLVSEGYYYEWMRAEWLADENPAMAMLALTEPAYALRAMAPGFKRAQPRMDQMFWSSRFGR
jgi:hypothetical protein